MFLDGASVEVIARAFFAAAVTYMFLPYKLQVGIPISKYIIFPFPLC